MFKNRKVTITLDKKAPGEEEEDPEQFHKNLKLVKEHVEDLGLKLLLGIGAYIFMDTCRQVIIENHKGGSND